MRTRSKQKIRSHRVSALLLLIVLVMVGCVFLDDVIINQGTEDAPKYWVKAGEVATFTLQGHIDAAEGRDSKFLVALLVPKSWNARENTVVTYVATGKEDGVTPFPMSPVDPKLIPTNVTVPWADALKEEYGVGDNVLNDMEWVAYCADKLYSIANGDKFNYTITFKCTAGPKNLRFKPAFFVNFAHDDFAQDERYNKYWSEQCFEVVEGEGSVVDFCSFHFNKIEPLTVLQDDFVTFTFLGDIYPNKLVGEGKNPIYMESTAYTDNGNIYTVTERSDRTLMTKEDRTHSNIYSLTIWPAGYFGIPEGETITRIEYIFTNKDGTITITQTDDDIASEGGEVGDTKEPFVCELQCE